MELDVYIVTDVDIKILTIALRYPNMRKQQYIDIDIEIDINIYL